MLKRKIYFMIILLLAGIFIVSTSTADENADKNFKMDNGFADGKMHPKIELNLLKEKSGGFASQIQNQDTIQVIFELKNSDKTIIRSLQDKGAVVEAVHKNLVQASVPASQLQEMAEMPSVDYVRKPLRAYKDAPVVSEGVGVINASLLHANGFKGQGVKIAVIDIGFNNYTSKRGSELPSNVITKSFRNDRDITGKGEEHGTAVAEIVNDVAPDAQLYLINFDTEVEFANAVQYAMDQNVDIISMSVGWLPGPYDGTGFIDDIANDATAKGIVWVNSAGNYAQKHWEGIYNETTATVNSGMWFVQDFNGGDNTNSFYAQEGDTIIAILSWDDWPRSNQDYDLLLVNDTHIVWGSGNTQDGTQEPSEAFSYKVTKSERYGIMIMNYSATGPVNFDLYLMSNHSLEYKVSASSLSLPADARGVIAVGASHWSNDTLESFSSQGPTNDGRTKPDVVAPDGVNTSTSPSPFYGTSASAPHVAGAAALLFSANPSFTNETLRFALESTAKNLGDAGKDNLTGYGRIDVWAAAFETPPIVTANNPINLWVRNGTILHLNASIVSVSGVKNATVDVSGVNNTINKVVLVPGGYWINDSISVNTSNSGLQNLTITVYDNAGNMNMVTNMTVRVDNEAPNVTISSPVNNSFINLRNVTITGRVIDNLGIGCVSIEHIWQIGVTNRSECGGFQKDIPININVTLLEGWNSITINYTDFAGNSGKASVNVTLDTVLPAVTNLSLSESMPKINTSVNITANLSDINLNTSSVFVSVKHPKGYTNISLMDNKGNDIFSYNYTNTTEYGRYDVMIIAGDLAGNINNTEKTWFVTKKSHILNVSIYAYKGEIAYGLMIWNRKNFPGLVLEETLNVQNVSNRTIPKDNILYNTSKQIVRYKVNEFNSSLMVDNGLDNNGNIVPTGGYYAKIGWQGIPYIAFNGKANKITPLIIEQGISDSKILSVGETWYMGEGWALTLNSTDTKAPPDQASLMLSKNGVKKDDNVIFVGTPDARPLYTYVESGISGESNVPVFVTYAENITNDNISLKYTWLISSNVTEIMAGDTFGTMKVTNTNPLELKNSDMQINLSPDSSIQLMDDLYFKTTTNIYLEYYPIFKRTGIPITATSVNATENDVTLEILTNQSMDGTIEVIKMADISSGMNRSFGLTPFGKFFTINASSNIENHSSWIKLRFYYTTAELTASGLDENSLKVSWYNESGNQWQILNTGSPDWVYGTGVDTADTGGYAGSVWFNISHLSTFALVGSYPAASTIISTSGGSGGGGGGGGGTSGENYSNIILKEKYEESIYKDMPTSYKFKNESNPVRFVNITGNVNAGLINTAVEVLKSTSSLVKEAAPGIVYRDFNIWVGTSGFPTSKNIKEATVMFRVENSWIDGKAFAGSEIKLVKWDNGTWKILETSEKMKDGTYTYFEGKTTSFSPFAATGIKEAAPSAPLPAVAAAAEAATSTPLASTETAQPGNLTMILVVIVLISVIGLIAAVYMKRK